MQAVVFIEAKGKANAWTRIARRLGMTATVVPTIGHVCSFPRKLYPIGIDLSSGEGLEKERHPIPEKRRAILEAVSNAPAGAAIIIATDDDVEGDVIAYDVADIVYSAFPERAKAIVRVRPGPITVRGIRTSLASAQPLERILVQMTSDAIPGRARAVTDRWIGATFSRIAGAPVGRVRSAILGATYLLNRAPEKLRGRPETGEITLQARSAMGGRPFVARVPLTGAEDPARITRLRALAERYAMRMVPGSVRPLMSLSAAVAPRIGTVRPFTTADALAHAARHHGIPVRMAMQGLQDAYLRGMISYPRTSGRGISAESASHVEMLAHSCGVTGLDVEVLSSDNMLAGPAPGAHEGLHPVLALSTENSDVLRTLIRKPLRAPEGGWDRTSVMQAMVALVSRRAFEAAREIPMERGNWGPDNGDMGISADDMEILRDLEWFRDMGFTFPWTRSYATGVKQWPLDAVLVELMAEEGIGRPSSYASHVETALRSGDLVEGAFPLPPRPSPKGVATLKKVPASLWRPEVCRMIEEALENEGNRLGENQRSPLATRARHRILAWLKRTPDDMREPLLEALCQRDGTRGLGGVSRAAEATETSPLEVSTDLPAPAPAG